MDKKEIEQLLLRYAGGTCSKEEIALVEDWYMQFRPNDRNDLQEEQIEQYLSAMRKELPLIDIAPLPQKQAPLWHVGWSRLRNGLAAAAAIAAVTLGTWLYYTNESASGNQGVVNNDIAPGHNTATLTLANGHIINLDTNKTSVVVIDSVKTLTMLTASAPRGGTYQVVLPDGTKAWLNAASSIKFPSSFAGMNQRRVEITGEVYLEVHKDKTRPFIAESKGQQVEVLGTHFNINAYGDEGATKTTLLEGSVKVNNAILKPGQQSILSNNQIKITKANTAEELAWKEGYFRFNEEKLSGIMKTLERWYDVTIILDDKIGNKQFSGKIARTRNISRVLSMMEETNSIRFTIEGRRILAVEK